MVHRSLNALARLALPGEIHARVPNQTVHPGREPGIPSKLANTGNQLEVHLLGGVARRRRITVKEIEGNGINTVFRRLVERTKGIPIPGAARRDDVVIDLVVAQGCTNPLDEPAVRFLPLLCG